LNDWSYRMPRSLIALAIATAFGVSAGTAHALDLLEAVRTAAAIDPVVAAAQAQLQASRERINQANALLLPAVSATSNDGINVVDNNWTAAPPRRRFDSQSLNLIGTQPLFRPIYRETLKQSELSTQVYEAQLAAAKQDLILRVSQAYFDVLSAQDALTVVRAQKQAFSEQFASAKRNFEVGTATITDQQEAQSRLDLTRSQEVAFENDLQVKRALLAQLLGKPVEELNTLKSNVDITPPQAARENEWAAVARAQSLQVVQSELQAEIAKREIDKQRYGHYPTVDLALIGNAGRSTAGQTTAAGVGIKSYVGQAQLQFALPIYSGGSVDAKVREAIALQSSSESTLETSRRTAEQSARQTFLGVKSGLEQVRALTAAERSSQLALESNQLGYQVGVRINIDVLNAAQQLFSTQRDLAFARYGVVLNSLKLLGTAGDLTEQEVLRVNALLEPPRTPPPKITPEDTRPVMSGDPLMQDGGGKPPGQPSTANANRSPPTDRGGRAAQPTAPAVGSGARVLPPPPPVIAPATPATPATSR
jgi:outer membrane protein